MEEPTAEQLAKLGAYVAKLEEALSLSEGQVLETAFREHARAIVDVYRGRRLMAPAELEAHLDAARAAYIEAGARIGEILEGVELAMRARSVPGSDRTN